MPESIVVLNGTGKSGLSAACIIKTSKDRYRCNHVGKCKHFDYRSSNVVYPINAKSGMVKTAQILGKLLDIPNSLVRANNQAFYPSIIIGHDSKELIGRIDKLIEISSQ